ncbi:TetR/AcrR family transcriptional regulator [Agromyces sp. NPDC049794]|uniref:TetR/AcrR family transcriptional regulator n=1 Tax=unclassified Agromyces TaxID=2639701 RepID=UPI0033C75AED
MSDPSRGGAAIDADDDRASLVAAASELFYAHGIQAVGMDTVRAASGVPLKRVYRAFRSKDDLVEATLRDRDAGIAASVRRFLDARSGDSPTERVLAVFDWLHEWFAEDSFRGCAFVNAFGELGDDAAPVAEAVRDHKRAFRSVLRRLVDELGLSADDADALAERLYIVANGAMVTAPITGSPATAAEAKAVARVLVEAATVRPASGAPG